MFVRIQSYKKINNFYILSLACDNYIQTRFSSRFYFMNHDAITIVGFRKFSIYIFIIGYNNFLKFSFYTRWKYTLLEIAYTMINLANLHCKKSSLIEATSLNACISFNNIYLSNYKIFRKICTPTTSLQSKFFPMKIVLIKLLQFCPW